MRCSTSRAARGRRSMNRMRRSRSDAAMLEQFKSIVSTQFEAALCMLDDCLRKCPDDAWDARVAKYPFWEVAYHALIFVDLYLDRSKEAFAFRPDVHPGGWREWDDEHPTRRFSRGELLDYVQV